MLNRDNARDVERVGDQLFINKLKLNTSRALRRFLNQVIDEQRKLSVVYADDEGYDPEQLAALEAFAIHCDMRLKNAWHPQSNMLDIWTHQGLRPLGVTHDQALQAVTADYEVLWPVATASLKQLQAMTYNVMFIADQFASFARNEAYALGCVPTYHYRNLPCSIVPRDELWEVSGQDKRGGSGVLEWCYNEEDANKILARMKQFPKRFLNISARPHADA